MKSIIILLISLALLNCKKQENKKQDPNAEGIANVMSGKNVLTKPDIKMRYLRIKTAVENTMSLLKNSADTNANTNQGGKKIAISLSELIDSYKNNYTEIAESNIKKYLEDKSFKQRIVDYQRAIDKNLETIASKLDIAVKNNKNSYELFRALGSIKEIAKLEKHYEIRSLLIDH